MLIYLNKTTFVRSLASVHGPMGTKEQSYAGQVSVDQRVRRYNEKAAAATGGIITRLFFVILFS